MCENFDTVHIFDTCSNFQSLKLVEVIQWMHDLRPTSSNGGFIEAHQIRTLLNDYIDFGIF